MLEKELKIGDVVTTSTGKYLIISTAELYGISYYLLQSETLKNTPKFVDQRALGNYHVFYHDNSDPTFKPNELKELVNDEDTLLDLIEPFNDSLSQAVDDFLK